MKTVRQTKLKMLYYRPQQGMKAAYNKNWGIQPTLLLPNILKVAVHLVSGQSEDFTESAEGSATNLSIFSMHTFTQPVCWIQWLPDWSTSYISCIYQCKHYTADNCTLINLQKIGSEMASFALFSQRPPIIQY